MEQCRTAWSFVCVPQHGSVSLIDILDTVAPPLSPHILALTPSAPWINSLLAHEQRQDSWSGHFHFLGFFFFKKKIPKQDSGRHEESGRCSDSLGFTSTITANHWSESERNGPPLPGWCCQAGNHAAWKSDFFNTSFVIKYLKANMIHMSLCNWSPNFTFSPVRCSHVDGTPTDKCDDMVL